jgi:FAD-dependent oxidoreductase domain-containing protein 1
VAIEFDVVIAGGGVMGSSCAYFLHSSGDFHGSIAVVEPDPSYREAASTRSASSIRQQFSTPLNIALSVFGLDFLRATPRLLQHDGTAPDLSLVESTYLYLATAEGRRALEDRVSVQQLSGVPVRLHDRDALAARYPWLHTADLAAGSDTAAGEGWFDGQALLAALRAANLRAGVRYLRDRVLALELSGARIVAAKLQAGGRISCRYAVNTTGTHARGLAASVGVELPVFPRKRHVFVFTCPVAIAPCPLVIDPSGLWFRPERDRFLCGPPAEPDPDVAADDFDVDVALFESRAWPLLAHRVPAFEAARLHSAWVGHYDYNAFDQNAFVGPVPSIPNFLLASGFSGHGLQQAPGVGRALAEYIRFGRYRTLDLTPLSYARFLANAPLREFNVI